MTSSNEEQSNSDSRLLAARWCSRSAALSGLIAVGLIVIQLVSRGSWTSGLDGMHPQWLVAECGGPLCLSASLLPMATVWMFGGVLLLSVRKGLIESWRPARALSQCLIPLLMVLVPYIYSQAMMMAWMTNSGFYIIIFLTIPILAWVVSLIALFVRLTQTRFADEDPSDSDPRLLAPRWCLRSATLSGFVAVGLITIQLSGRGSASSGLAGLRPDAWIPEWNGGIFVLFPSLVPVAVMWMLGGSLLLWVGKGLRRSWRPARTIGQCLVPLLTLLVPQVYMEASTESAMLSGAEVQIVTFLTVPILAWLVSLFVLFVRLTQTRFASAAENSDPQVSQR